MKLSSILLNLANLKQRIDQLAYNYGLIADYVVEYGTSGIWTYRKWASGIAECWGKHTYTSLPLTRNFNGVYIAQSNNPQGMDAYPFTFYQTPKTFAYVTNTNAWILSDSEGSTTNFPKLWVALTTSGTTNPCIYLSATGYWKNMGG